MTTTYEVTPERVHELEQIVDSLSEELAALRSDVNHLDRGHTTVGLPTMTSDVAQNIYKALVRIMDAACPELDGNGQQLAQILDDVSNALWPDEDTEALRR